MSYVPDETVLGNPGFFGFIGKAVKAVVGVAGKVIGAVSGGGSVTVAPPQVVVQTPAPTVSLPSSVPKWVLPVAIGGGALVLVLLLAKRR